MIGIDIGFGYTKIFQGEGIDPIVFPSVFAPYRDRLNAMSNAKGCISNMTIEYEGAKYHIGETAKTEGGTSTFDKDNHLRHILCSLASIALATGGEDYTGPVVMGLPVSDMKIKKRAIEDLKGVYKINFCDKPVTINLTSVMVVPQGAAGFYDLIYSDNGKPIPGCSVIKKYVGVIDIGEKTLDFVTMDSGKYISAKSGSADMGMNQAYIELVSILQEKLSFSVKPYQTSNYAHRIPKETKEVYRKLAHAIVDDISRYWGSFNQFEEILLSGGGGEALQEYIQERIPNCRLISDAQFSNARGYYKCGKAQGNSK